MAIRDIAWLLVVCAVGLVVRLPFLTMPMIADEGGYAYATRGWLNGTGELYDDLWISRPQGIFYLYALIFETLGTDTIAFRLAAWISACGTAVAVWAIARRWRSSPVASIASILFIVLAASPDLEGYTANAEMFMMLPSAWSVWTLIKAMESRWSPTWLVLTGILIGVATMLKPSGIVMAPVAIIAIVAITQSEPAKQSLRPVSFVLSGIAIIGIPALIHGAILGWSDFFYAAVVYRLTMQSSANVALSDHLAQVLGLTFNGILLLLMIALVVGVAHRRDLATACGRARATLPTLSRSRVLTGLRRTMSQLHKPGTERHLAVPNDRIGMLLRLWTLAAFTGIAVGGDWWSHYLVQVVAPFSIWFAAMLLTATRSVRRWVGPLLTIGATAVFLAPFWVIALGSTEEMSDHLFVHPGYQAQEEIANWLQEHSEPGTPIYVAFDQAAIYYLANRPPAYRHLYDQELRAIPGSYSDIISIIRSPSRPRYIVSTRQPGPFPDESRVFWQEVGQYYELETMIEGVPIYEARQYTPPVP